MIYLESGQNGGADFQSWSVGSTPCVDLALGLIGFSFR